MRTVRSTLGLLIVVATISFFFGLGQRQATADPIENCTSLSCLEVYCWWIATDDEQWSVQQTGTAAPPGAGSKNVLHAIPSIFGAATNGKTPLNNAGTADKYSWSSSTKRCAKIGGSFPSPQAADPGGTATFEVNITKKTCTPDSN